MKCNINMILKDGRKCELRNACADDAKQVCDIFQLTHSQTDFLASYPDEKEFDVEEERQFLKDKENSPNEIQICAVVDNKIVGIAGIDKVGSGEKVKHRTEVGISVDNEFWGLGIGTKLLKLCIETAKKAGYTQMELSVVADNRAAISLYKKLNFKEYGRNPKGFRSRSNGWQELILMLLPLD